MRLLWVKAGKLLPVDTGGKIRSYNLLRQLADRHALTLLSYYSGDRDPQYDADLEREFPGALTVATGKTEDTALRAGWHYATRAWWPAPYAVAKFTSPAVKTIVARALSERRFDVAICDFLSASLNFPASSVTPSVLFQHNVESLLWNRQATHEPSVPRRLVYKLEAAKMRRYEAGTVGRFGDVIAVSDHDKQAMARMTDPARITVVPTGVDIAKYSASANPIGRGQEVIFLGSMDWDANVDGVEFFCRDVWPSVVARVPGARFSIVGRNPAPRVRRLVSESVTVTGAVDSVLPYLERAAVFVVPLRIGGGTRLKIFEGMAMGKATVSTTIGAEGLDVTDGRDLILADQPAAFADAVAVLLTDVDRRRALGEAAARLARQYDWSAVVGRFEEALERARAGSATSQPALAGASA